MNSHDSSMLDFATYLCQMTSGSHCSLPRWSEWCLKSPEQTSIGVDLVDTFTLGAGAVIPANIKVRVGSFSTGIARDDCPTDVHRLSGAGLGGGVSAGFNTPVEAKGGQAAKSMAKVVGETVGGPLKEILVEAVKTLDESLSVNAGSRLIYGPDAPPAGLHPLSFKGFASIFQLSLNLGVSVGFGLLMFSRRRPIIWPSDFLHVTAMGIVFSVTLSSSFDGEAQHMIYRVD